MFHSRVSGGNPILVLSFVRSLPSCLILPLLLTVLPGGPFYLSFNMLNYFTTLGSRGAQTEDQRVDQLTRITAGALALNADSIAIIEVRSMKC